MADKNPFAEVAPANRESRNSKLGWLVAAILALLLIALFVLWVATRVDPNEMTALRSKLDKAMTDLTAAQSEHGANQDQIAQLKSQIATLEKEKEAESQMSKVLENEMRTDLESKDVTISNLQGKLTVNILDRILFDSGEAALKPDGQAVMQKIAAILAKHPDLKIHVIGHTDNVPIRPAARSRFPSNWELSAARALAAVHFLSEQAGVDSRRMGAVGYGEFRPIADNSTAEGRAKNRRIAVTILPDELAAADTVATTKTNLSTNGDSLSAPPPAAQ